MRVTGLHVHPVKSTTIRDLDRARVHRWGLAGDRRWMVVDGDGRMLTARKVPELFRIVADVTQTGGRGDLTLRSAGHSSLAVVEPRGPDVETRVFSSPVVGVDAGDEAAAWLAEVLALPGVRLLHCADPARRRLDPRYSEPGDHAAFADGFPLLLTGEASLRRLQDWITETALERGEPVPDALPMRRFRPNLTVDHPEPFAEDGWRVVQVGAVRMRVAVSCGRCVMTTLDPRTRDYGKEPLRTLARHRSRDGKLLFGQNLVPEHEGVIRVGDQVRVLS